MLAVPLWRHCLVTDDVVMSCGLAFPSIKTLGEA
jgi:hypothetical protein